MLNQKLSLQRLVGIQEAWERLTSKIRELMHNLFMVILFDYLSLLKFNIEK